MAHDIGKCVRTKDVLSNIDVLFENDSLIEKCIRQGLADNGFIKESPIQMAAFPYVLNGYDAIVQSKSGTGKSIVFVVAALNKLVKVPVHQTQTIILAPTREIAVQITDVVRSVGAYVQNLHVDYFIGGTPVARPKVTPQVVVGSPGRVKQLIKLKHLSVDAVRLLILDEADKLINGAFVDDITWIYSQLPAMKQMLVVSATYSPDNLATLHKYMIDPLLIRPEDASRPLIGVKQLVALIPEPKNSNLRCVDEEKKLVQLLSHTPFNQCVVFSNYQLRPEVISENLTAAQFGSVYLSGAQEQTDRLTALNAFKQGKVRILVTTDLAARGIDAANVNLVINLEIPHDAATYLHRMGRAGRYGTRGLVITIVSSDALVKFHSLMAEINLDHDFNVGLVPDNLSGANNWTQRVEVLLAKTRHKKQEDKGEEIMDKEEYENNERMMNGKIENGEEEEKHDTEIEEIIVEIVEHCEAIDSKASELVEDNRDIETNSTETKARVPVLEKSAPELKEMEDKMSNAEIGADRSDGACSKEVFNGNATASDSTETSRKNDRRKKRNNEKRKNKRGDKQQGSRTENVAVNIDKVETNNEKEVDAKPDVRDVDETDTGVIPASEVVLEPIDFEYISAFVNGEPTMNKSSEIIEGVPKQNEEVTQINIDDEYLIANMKTCVANDRARVEDLIRNLDHVDASVLADWTLNKHSNVAALFKNDTEGTDNTSGKSQNYVNSTNELGNCDINELSNQKDIPHGRELKSYDSLAMFSPCQTTLDKADEESRFNNVSDAFGKGKPRKKSRNRNKSNKENTNILNTPPKTQKVYNENRDTTPVRPSRRDDSRRKSEDGNVTISNGFEDSNLNESGADDRSFLQRKSKRLPARDLVVYDEIDMFSPAANNLDEYEIDYTYVEQYPNCHDDRNTRRGSMSSQDSLHHNDSLDIKLRKKIKPGNRLQRKKMQRQSNMDVSRMDNSGGDNDSSRNTSSTLLANEDSGASNGKKPSLNQKDLGRPNADGFEQNLYRRKGSNDDTDFQISWENNVSDRKAKKSSTKNATNAARNSRKHAQVNGKPNTSHIAPNKIAAESVVEGETDNDLAQAYEENFSELELSQYNDKEYVFLPESSDGSSYATTDDDTLDEEESDDKDGSGEYVESEDEDVNEGGDFDLSESSMASSCIALKCAQLMDRDEETCTDDDEEDSVSSDSFLMCPEDFDLMRQMLRERRLNADDDVPSPRKKGEKSATSHSKGPKKGRTTPSKMRLKGVNPHSKGAQKGGANGNKSGLNFRDWMREMELYNVSTNVNVSDDEDVDESYNVIKTPTPLKHLQFGANRDESGQSGRAGAKPLKNPLLRRALMNKQNEVNAWNREENDGPGVLPHDHQQEQPFQSNFTNSFNFDMDFSNMPVAQRMRGSRHANRMPTGDFASCAKVRSAYPEQYLTTDLSRYHHTSRRYHAPPHELMYTSSPRHPTKHSPADQYGHSGTRSSDARLNHSSLPGHSHGHYSHGGFSGTFRGPPGGLSGVVGGPMIREYFRSTSQFKARQPGYGRSEFEPKQKVPPKKEGTRTSQTKGRKGHHTAITDDTYGVFNDTNEIGYGLEDYVEQSEFDDSKNATFDSGSAGLTCSEFEDEASSDEDDVDSNASQAEVAKKVSQKLVDTKAADVGSAQSNGSFQSTQSGISGGGSSYKSISLEEYSIVDGPASVDISWQTCSSRVDQGGQADEASNRRNSGAKEGGRREKGSCKEKTSTKSAQDCIQNGGARKVGAAGKGKKTKQKRVVNPFEAPMPGAWQKASVDEIGEHFGNGVQKKNNRPEARGRNQTNDVAYERPKEPRQSRTRSQIEHELMMPNGYNPSCGRAQNGLYRSGKLAQDGGLHRFYSGSETGSAAHRPKRVKTGPLSHASRMPSESLVANHGTFMKDSRFLCEDLEGLNIGAYGRERTNQGNPRAKGEAKRYFEERGNGGGNGVRYSRKAQRDYPREFRDLGLPARYAPASGREPIRSRRYDAQHCSHGNQAGNVSLNHIYERLYSSGCEHCDVHESEQEYQESSGDIYDCMPCETEAGHCYYDEDGLVNDEQPCPYENVLRAHPAYYPGQDLNSMRRRLNRQKDWMETYQAQMRLYMNVARNIASSGAYDF